MRGEIAAAETYKQALDKVDDPQATVLREMQGDHGEAIKFLHAELAARGVEPPTSSGAWGVFSRAVEGTAKIFGDRAALAALREGEQRGLEDYEQALHSGLLPADSRHYVQATLIPRQRRHVEQLNRMIDGL